MQWRAPGMFFAVKQMLDPPEKDSRPYQLHYPPDQGLQNPSIERKQTAGLFRDHLWTQCHQHSTNNRIERDYTFCRQAMWTETDQGAFKVENNYPPYKYEIEELSLS